MILGVIAFGIANGQIISIIGSFHTKNAEYQKKLDTLNLIYQQYGLPLELF